MGEDRRDAGADVVATHQCCVTNENSGNVRDGVEIAGRKNADGNAEFASAGSVLGVCDSDY